jgi:hypothetical protein
MQKIKIGKHIVEYFEPEDYEHYCEMPLESDNQMAGPAISYCKQYSDGFLFAGNGEYESQVNFCPICGYKAKVGIENKESK